MSTYLRMHSFFIHVLITSGTCDVFVMSTAAEMGPPHRSAISTSLGSRSTVRMRYIVTSFLSSFCPEVRKNGCTGRS